MSKCAQSTCAVPKIKYPLSYTNSQCKGYMSGTAYLWDGWETESLLQRGKTHGSKEKSTPYFLFFRKMVIKTIRRAKLKPFNSTSCRSEGCSPTLRSCLTHPLPSCPSCKSCQESLMCFKSKSHTCSQVNNCFNTTPNLTRGKGQQNHIWDFSSLLT